MAVTGTSPTTHYAGIAIDGQVSEANYLAYNSVGALAAGGTQTLTNSVSTAGLSVGQHTLYVKDDYWYNQVSESDETDNTRAFTFNVSATENTLVLKPGPEGQDLWVTNVFDYSDNYGVDDARLLVGGWGDLYDALLKFDLTGSNASHVASATLRLYEKPGGQAQTGMRVDMLKNAWNESYGWHDYALQYDNIGTKAALSDGWNEIDVTSAVNTWLANPNANMGLQLRPLLTNNNFNEFVSSDATGELAQYRPELVLHPDYWLV